MIKNIHFRSLFCLFLSLLFHFLIFVFLLSDMSIITVQSASQEHNKILAEVILLPAKQAGKPGDQGNTENSTGNNFRKIEDVEVRIQINGEDKVNTTREIISEPAKTIIEANPTIKAESVIQAEPVVKAEPQKDTVIKPAESTKPSPAVKKADIVNKTAPAKETAHPSKTALNNTQDKHEIKTVDNKTNISELQGANDSSSASDNRSINGSGSSDGGSGNAAGIFSSHGSPIAGIDSVIVVNRIKPVYPQISRKRGEEGNVVLLASVIKGKVVNVTIEKSSGIKALDSSALTAVGKWSFSSDTNLTVRIPVSFKLKD
ncbi:MAG: TonB family protein [Synergistaceae bacterium]|nr:TonB family protein [Synergistaceae bacterium]